MKAALLKKWEELILTDIEKPIISKEEALIRVKLGGVCGSDITVYRGQHPTAVIPRVLCHEILGIIEKLPEGYNGNFHCGDRVLMNPVISCGKCDACRAGYGNVCANLKLIGIHENGGFAEYTKVPIRNLVEVNSDIPDKIAVLGEPFAVAYHVNIRSGVKKGDKVMIIGAGTIGIVVALVAREFGAKRVVISEINKDRLELAESFGIETINPAETDILMKTNEITDGIGFDVVYDASGSKAGALMLPDLGRIRGSLMSLSLSGIPYEFVLGKISFKEMTLIGSRLYSQEHFEAGVKTMEDLFRRQDLSKIVTDIMPLSKIVKAIEMMKFGKNIGKILIECNDN